MTMAATDRRINKNRLDTNYRPGGSYEAFVRDHSSELLTAGRSSVRQAAHPADRRCGGAMKGTGVAVVCGFHLALRSAGRIPRAAKLSKQRRRQFNQDRCVYRSVMATSGVALPHSN